MKRDLNININHLTRVEGHGSIVINAKNGKITKCEWQVPESPRFFEAIVRGRHYSEVARITSRICGICSIGHTLASVKATEVALGIKVTEQTIKLRRLLKHAENFDSHILHIYFLVAPDLLGVPSVFPLVKTHGEVVKRALRLKRLGHEWGSLVGGRTTHPTTVLPGGFSQIPSLDELATLKNKIISAIPDLEETVKTIASVAKQIPQFNRPTEYIALSSNQEYGLYNGDIQSTMPDNTSESYPVSHYKKITNEYISDLSTAKYCKHKMASYVAGALARFNNNHKALHSKAKETAKILGITPICTNPYMNTVAQLVEVVHNAYESIGIIDDLLKQGLVDEPLVKPSQFAKGASAVEVPRGILFHEYLYDCEGMCLSGNCVIPTNQNHGNIQLDMEKLVPELLQANKTEKEIALALEMLVRAYDPCISCSTHYLDVKFIK